MAFQSHEEFTVHHLGKKYAFPTAILLCGIGGLGRQSTFLKCMLQEWKIRLETLPRGNAAVLASTGDLTQTLHPLCFPVY